MKKNKLINEDLKSLQDLQEKYLKALDVETGVLINFPFPPEDEPEIIE